MRKFTSTLIKILSLVLSGITIIVAVSFGYHILNIVFTAIFGVIAYVVGSGIAAIALFLVQYLFVMALFAFIWFNVIKPNWILIPVSKFFEMLFTKPGKLIKGIFGTIKLSIEIVWLKLRLLTLRFV